ncbi:MAG: hypothetical protein P4L79_10050 [Legionella sp.]|uniref:hypothetical protein n=1 Tax=Legionella sp. TaxID=459 RepID=UPI00284A1135|nr:hypothetical protein [Legionella sp.]
MAGEHELTLELLQQQISELKAQLAAKPTKAKAEPGQPREGTKLYALTQMLQREGGVTNDEAKAEFGWPAISIKTMAANMGIPVRFEKEGREKRYYAITAEAIAAEAEAKATAAAAEQEEDNPFLLSVELGEEQELNRLAE